MKSIKFSLLAASIAGLLACGGDSNDPATVDRDDLNPPGFLFTKTLDKKIQIKFSTANVEDDLRGYHIFGTDKGLSELKAAVKYPEGADPTISNIPRCEDNNAFFTAFGLPETDTSCSGTTDAEEEATDEGSGLKTLAVEEPLKNFLPCSENTDATDRSLKAEAPSLGIQTCTVDKYYNGTELANITNAKTYNFFAVAVINDDLNEISWSSTLVTDSSSDTVELKANVDNSALASGKITLSPRNLALMTLSVGNGTDVGSTATVTPQAACATSDAKCLISRVNSETAADPTIWLARDNRIDAKYSQRLLISTNKDGNVAISQREPISAAMDRTDARVATDAPTSIFPAAGTSARGVTLPVYAGSIFDIQITQEGKVYYGKIVFETIEYTNKAKDTEKPEVDVYDSVVTAHLIMQPQADTPYYLQ